MQWEECENRITFRQTLVENWGHLGMGVENHLESTKFSYKNKSAFSASYISPKVFEREVDS